LREERGNKLLKQAWSSVEWACALDRWIRTGLWPTFKSNQFSLDWWIRACSFNRWIWMSDIASSLIHRSSEHAHLTDDHACFSNLFVLHSIVISMQMQMNRDQQYKYIWVKDDRWIWMSDIASSLIHRSSEHAHLTDNHVTCLFFTQLWFQCCKWIETNNTSTYEWKTTGWNS